MQHLPSQLELFCDRHQLCNDPRPSEFLSEEEYSFVMGCMMGRGLVVLLGTTNTNDRIYAPKGVLN